MRRTISNRLAAAALAACLLLPVGAAAQGTYRPPKVYNPNVYSRTRQAMSTRAAARAAAKRRTQPVVRGGPSGGRHPSSSPSPAPGNTTPAAGTTTFHPVADSIMPRQMALVLGDTPEEQRRLEKMFSDLLENYRDRLKQAGLPTNDVARAASYLVTASYAVSQDERVRLDDAQLTVLRQHMRDVFLEDEAFGRMSDRERQEMFEDFGITGTWIDVGYNIVRQAGDQKAMKQWREMARKNFINLIGTSPERVVFTASGIEYK
jgi:hypothetical protein